MRHLFFILHVTIVSGSFAQSTDDKEQVSAVVERLFKGMALGDSAMVHTCFADSVTTATIQRDLNGQPRLQRNAIAGFLRAVGTPHPDPWNEEIWNLTVAVDSDFAQAWCDYAFYVGDRFSHCGVDAFQLLRTNQGWKIFHLADTRRTQDCSIPDSIREKHKSQPR